MKAHVFINEPVHHLFFSFSLSPPFNWPVMWEGGSYKVPGAGEVLPIFFLRT